MLQIGIQSLKSLIIIDKGLFGHLEFIVARGQNQTEQCYQNHLILFHNLSLFAV